MTTTKAELKARGDGGTGLVFHSCVSVGQSNSAVCQDRVAVPCCLAYRVVIQYRIEVGARSLF